MDEQSDLATNEIRSLKNQNSVLQDKLDRSVAKIMRLQGGIDQITDGDVKKRFEGVFSAIQDWVAEIELDLTRHAQSFRGVFQDVLLREEQVRLLLKLNLRAHSEDDDGLPMWDPASQEYADMRWLGTLDTCINVVLCRFIWWRLQGRIFQSSWPFGLDDWAKEGLDYIIEAIADEDQGEVKIDPEAVFRARKWKAESMATLVLTKRFREDKELEMKDFIRDLYEDLTFRKLSIDTETLSRHMKSFETDVLGPAVELQQTISCSSTEYYSFEPDRELMQNVRDGDRIWDYTFKDIVEWRDRAPTETCGNMFCLFPGFYRKGMKIADDVILVKPTLLVLNRDTISKLQEYRKFYGSTQNMRQRSPGTDETVPSRWSSLPPHGSHSSTARSVNDRQRTSRRKRDEHHWSFLRAFQFGNDKKLDEMPGSEAKTRSHRRATEERDPRATPPRDAKGKEKRSRRGNPTPASSRKPSLSQSYPEATTLPNEHSVGLRSPPVTQEIRYVSHEEVGALSSNEKYLSSLPTPGKGGEELESSHIDSSINEHPILEEAAETRDHVQLMRSIPETSRPIGQSGYTPKAHPHPQEQGFLKEQCKLSKSPLL